MAALTILIIRHAEKPAEKPEDPDLGPGLTEMGETDSESLVVRGWQRAGAWAALFGGEHAGADYPRPDAIFAAKPGAPGKLNEGPSRRPAETAAPLAARLGLGVDTSFAKKGGERALVAKVLGLAGVVLITWEHDAIISDILPAIPTANRADVPDNWPRDRYDVVLRFDRAEGDQQLSFRALFPRLLDGDSDKPLDR
jgi:hypothetical protein